MTFALTEKKDLWKAVDELFTIKDVSIELGKEYKRQEYPKKRPNFEKTAKQHHAITTSMLAVLDIIKKYQEALKPEQQQSHSPIL